MCTSFRNQYPFICFFVRDCRAGKTAYAAFHLSSMFNLTAVDVELHDQEKVTYSTPFMTSALFYLSIITFCSASTCIASKEKYFCVTWCHLANICCDLLIWTLFWWCLELTEVRVYYPHESCLVIYCSLQRDNHTTVLHNRWINYFFD